MIFSHLFAIVVFPLLPQVHVAVLALFHTASRPTSGSKPRKAYVEPGHCLALRKEHKSLSKGTGSGVSYSCTSVSMPLPRIHQKTKLLDLSE